MSRRSLLLAAAFALLPACTIETFGEPPPVAPVQPAAAPVTPIAASAGFTRVAAEGAVDVVIDVRAKNGVALACDPSLSPLVHTEVEGDRLRIWTDRSFGGSGRGARCTVLVEIASLRALAASGSGSVHVRGQAEGLGSVAATGSGDVTIDALAAESARLVASGSGSVHLAGASDRVQIDCSGSGDVDARGLEAADVVVQASGSASVYARASRRASVSTSGSGDVHIAGRPPERDAARTGSGEIAFE
jgi:hypothetical protein